MFEPLPTAVREAAADPTFGTRALGAALDAPIPGAPPEFPASLRSFTVRAKGWRSFGWRGRAVPGQQPPLDQDDQDEQGDADDGQNRHRRVDDRQVGQ